MRSATTMLTCSFESSRFPQVAQARKMVSGYGDGTGICMSDSWGCFLVEKGPVPRTLVASSRSLASQRNSWSQRRDIAKRR
mmetsp:Transcript_4098/g.7897  ORF Transcript_4098/g.7897 Transcript_4098/m.7897 type:complete len:81 (+) Transcript_4098:371-613(+)